MEKVLVTGFEKFADLVENPSQTLIDYLGQQSFPQLEVRTEVLPVQFGTAFEKLEPELRSFEPQRLLMFGVAVQRTQPELECYAHNISEGPGRPRQEILPEGPDALPTTYDWNGVFDRLSKKHLLGLSYSAGSFVCNDLYFRVLLATRYTMTRSIFVHVPNWPKGDARFESLQKLAVDLVLDR